MHRAQGEVNVFVRSCILDQKTVSGHCAKFLIFHRCCVCVLIYQMAIVSYYFVWRSMKLQWIMLWKIRIQILWSPSLFRSSCFQPVSRWLTSLIHILHNSPAKGLIANHHALKVLVGRSLCLSYTPLFSFLKIIIIAGWYGHN